MRCSAAIELLERYLENELDEVQTSKLESHLENCLGCQRELELTHSIQIIIKCIEKPKTPEDIIPETLERLHKSKEKLNIREFLIEKWKYAVPAFMILLLVIGFAYLMPDRKQEITKQEVVKAAEDLKLALGIVKVATEEVETTTLKASAQAFSITKDKSRGTMENMAKVQDEVIDSLKRNLALVSKKD
ncbi:hypothetical protein GF312_17000 [Candidatus Poribacteria bacterium]|nr:hypothetical protein [Candidatus Poribacteria bacterium]